MSTPPEADDSTLVVHSAAELLPHVEIVDVHYYELRARRFDSPREEFRDTRPLLEIQASVSNDPDNFWVKMRADLTTFDGEYVVDAVAHYKISRKIEIDETAAKDFVDRVGMFALYPYLREGLHSLQSKLRLTITTLGVIRQGQFSQSEPPEED